MNYAFGALWGAWLLFWFAFARGNKRTATPVGLRWRFNALAASLVVLLGSRQCPEYFRHPLRPPRAAWAYIGLALTAGGLGFTMWARRALGTNWSAMPGLKKDHELIERGPYRLVRHPIYTGLIAAAFATAAIRATPWALLGAALFSLGFALKARVEERFLENELGGYDAYRGRVRMIVPFLL